MKEVFESVPYGIDHTMLVLKDAQQIADGENICGAQRELICVTAILHDIGAVEAQRKYGSMKAAYQEKEGPPIARDILAKCGYDDQMTDRVCFIIGHHHTPSRIDGVDFQIQWEADLLSNLVRLPIRNHREKLGQFLREQFTTGTGFALAMERFMA